MKAVILAAGPAIRLRPSTEQMPKCLISLAGVTILDRIIQSLIENNVTDIVITTGYLEEKIKNFMQEKYPQLNITYVKNPIYDKTNYIYSLWLAKDIIGNDDIILLHGDLIYNSKLMEHIINQNRTSALIKRDLPYPEKDFKARIKNGLIAEIGVKVFGNDARFCAPVYKFLNSDFKILLNEMDKFIKDGKVNSYAEDAFNVISDQIKLYPLYFDNELCMEVDDFEDLEKAKAYLKINKPSIKEIRDKYNYSDGDTWYARIVCRKFSVYFIWFFVRTPISPNQITLLMILIGIIGGVFLAIPGYVNGLIGVLFLQLFLILDCTDGGVARSKRKFSSKGKFLDLIANDIVFVSIFAGMIFRIFNGQNFVVIIAGFSAIVFFLLSKLFPLYAKEVDEKLTGKYLNPIIFNTKIKSIVFQIIKNLTSPPHVIAIVTLGAIFNMFSYVLFFYGIFFFLYYFASLIPRLNYDKSYKKKKKRIK